MKKVIKIVLFALCLIGLGSAIQAANEPAECTYCAEPFNNQRLEITIHRPAGANENAHTGCRECIENALAIKRECPVCRKHLTPADFNFMNDPVAQQAVREQQKKLNEKNNAPKPAAKKPNGKPLDLSVPALLCGFVGFLRWYAEQLAQII